MNLGEVRTKFIKISGRDDLVNADLTDNGANFYINAGQQFLDKRFGYEEVQLDMIQDTDTSYWTLEAPITLLFAALYQLEASYRNTEGVKDWLNVIDLDLDGLEKDRIAEEIMGVDQMEG
jgi:hypothetical protein